MRIAEDAPPALSALDRPNSYIGRSVPRPNLARLTQGRAQFVSDLTLPRMAHVAFVRSPHGISIEILQNGENLPPAEPWASMGNTRAW